MARNRTRSAGAVRAERFEAWLSGEDLMHARAAMRASGCRKKSDFVRQRLVRGAGLASASETGKLCLAVNATLLELEQADHPEAVRARLDDLRDLLRLLILARLPDTHSPKD
ncbi:hypothetical protein [Rhodobaculum claviforme]|nr:hypothetical protein [Rhodobaculum claviforme]